MNNRERFQRAVNAADQLAQGGLNEKQQQFFVETTRDQTGLQKAGARVEILQGGTYEIPKMGLSQRVAVPKTYARNEKFRRLVSPSNIKLNPKDIVVSVELEDKMLRDAVGNRDVTEDMIIEMFAKQAANNLEMLLWNGNTTGPAILESNLIDGGSTSQYMLDVLYTELDGILKQAESGHRVNVTNADLSTDWIAKALITLPDKWQEDISKLKLFLSTGHNHKFNSLISSRATALGDQTLGGKSGLSPFGVQFLPQALLNRNPTIVEHLAANNDGTTVTQLKYAPVTDLVLLPTTLGINAESKFVLSTDYSQDLANGTWTRLGGGSIGSAATIKSTYKSGGRALLTDPMNIVVGLVADKVKILKDHDIHGDVHQYAIHMSVDVKILDTDALVDLYNIKDPI